MQNQSKEQVSERAVRGRFAPAPLLMSVERVCAEFEFPKDRAELLVQFMGLLAEPERREHAIDEMIDRLEITQMRAYKQKLRLKSYYELLRVMNLRFFPKGSSIIQKDTIVRDLYVIVTGVVQIVVPQSCQEIEEPQQESGGQVQAQVQGQGQGQVHGQVSQGQGQVQAQAQQENKRPESRKQLQRQEISIVKFMREGRLGQLSLHNKLSKSSASAVAFSSTLVLAISAEAFDRTLMKLESSEHSRTLDFFREFYFFKILSTERLRKIINSMVRATLVRGEVLVQEAEPSSFIYFVYEGSLLVEQEILTTRCFLREQRQQRRLIKVSEIGVKQAYGFEQLYPHASQRVTVNSNKAEVFIISAKKLLADAPQIKALLRCQSMEKKMHFRQECLNKQVTIQHIRRSENLAPPPEEVPAPPKYHIPLLIDPNTMMVESGFRRKESIPIRIRTKFMDTSSSKQKRPVRQCCPTCKECCTTRKTDLPSRTPCKFSQLNSRARRLGTSLDSIDSVIKKTNLFQTELMRMLVLRRQ